LEDFVNSIPIIYIVNYKVLIELVFQRILFYICFILYFREKIAVIRTKVTFAIKIFATIYMISYVDISIHLILHIHIIFH